MKRILYYAAFLVLSSQALFSQGLRAEIKGFKGDRVYLFAYQGDDMVAVDSIAVLDEKLFYIPPEGMENGLYHLYFADPRNVKMVDSDVPGIDIVFDNENIDISTNFLFPVSGMKVKQSVSNQVYYRYLNYNMGYRRKLGNLMQLAELYSVDDPFFPPLVSEIIKIQEDYNDSILLFSSRKPGSFISEIILFMKEPVYDPSTSESLEIFMRDSFLKPVNFNVKELLKSPFLTQKILTYLSFYRLDASDPEDQEANFILAVDRLMNEITYEQQVYDFVLNYLIDGFERFQMDRVLVHVADNYLSGECETDNEKIMKDRLEAYRKMVIGQKVNDIRLLDSNGNPVSLSGIKKDYTILVFWASWCPHCNKTIPRISDWYKNLENKEQLGLFLVSIDTSRADWEEFILLNEMEGVNVLDPEGWDGKIARQFNLYATPTIFILDRDRKIVDKPMTIRDIRKYMAETGLEE